MQTVYADVAEAGAMTCHERKRDWRKYSKWQCREIVLACTVLRGPVDNSGVHDRRRNGWPGISNEGHCAVPPD